MQTTRPRRRPLTRVLGVLAASALAVTLVPGAPSYAAPSSPSAAPSSAPSPSAPGAGGAADLDRWQVTALGEGRYDVAWTSPALLALTSDRPSIEGAGLVFGPPVVDDDGRTVRAVVTAASAPDPAALDVVLSGDRLDEPGLDGVDAGGVSAAEAPATTELPAPDPGRTGDFAVVSSDYELDPVKLSGMREPIEMVGHVVQPAADAATGPRPLVLFQHGRHSVCYDPADPDAFSDEWPCAAPFEEIQSQLGYDYVQRLLASQGYATVSVRVNGINAQDYRLPDGGAGARAAIIERHLDHWADLAAVPGTPEALVDLDEVVLVGHSRGGEGVDRASIRIPLSAPYRVAGQVLIAPTDFGAQTAPYVPTVTLLPYCDGDVSDLQGQQYTDTGRDLVDDDTSLKSSVLVMGANHNFFNTEWTPSTTDAPAGDDWFGGATDPCGTKTPERLSAREQRAVGAAYVAGAVALFTGDGGSRAYLPLFDGSAVTVDSIGDADVRSHALGGGRVVRRPGTEATLTLASGGARTRLCRGVASTSGTVGACLPDNRSSITPHWGYPGSAVPTRQFFEMGWTRAGARGGLALDEPLDLSTDRLELRTIVDPRRGPVDVQVRLGDSAGATTTVEPATLEPLLRAPYLTKLWAQSLLVDPAAGADGASGGADLSDIVSVELVAQGERGRIWVADLSAAPDALAPVPATRPAQVRLGSLELPEGDTPAKRTARVPFEVVGELAGPARFTVQTTGQERGARQVFAVDLAPGQRSGTIPVAYTADTVADYPSTTTISAYAVSGVVTDDYLGDLEVVDDDPQPVPTARAVQRRVVEGEPIVVRVRFSEPADYELGAGGQVVDGPGRGLSANDVPPRWLVKLGAVDGPPDTPLSELYAGVYASAPVGETSVDLVVPTRRDRRVEGPETLTLALRAGDERFRITVTVLDAARGGRGGGEG